MNKTFKIHMSGELSFTADNLALIQSLEDAMSQQTQYLYSDQSDCMKRFVDDISDAIAYRDQWDLDNPYKAPKKVEAA